MVHEQQEPQEKKEEYRNILALNFNSFLKDWNKLQIILMMVDKFSNSKNILFFFLLMKYNGFILLDFLFSRCGFDFSPFVGT